MTHLRQTNWDAVITSAPLNKQAAMIRDGRSSAEVEIQNSFVERPPLREYHGPAEGNLKDKRFGQLIVVGLGGKSGQWVCACLCGKFALMTARGLRVQADKGRAMCGECDYVVRVQAGEIPTAAERLILRTAKQAKSEGITEAAEALFPKLDALVADLDPAMAMAVIGRWIQRQRALREEADPSTAAHREDD